MSGGGSEPPQFHLLYGDGAGERKVGHHHEIEDSIAFSLVSIVPCSAAVSGSKFPCRESKRQ